MKMIVLYSAIAIIVALLAFWSISSYHFEKMIHGETELFLHPQENDSLTLFDYNALVKLPPPVRRYLKHAIPDGYPMICMAELSHKGYFRIKPSSDWWPIQGEEYFRTAQPAYLWIAEVSPYPMVWLKARDKYWNGHGEMLVRLYSSLTISKAKNKQIDQSALIRFAGEMPWFPTAFVNNSYVHWQAVDDHSARATISNHDSTLSVTYFFNEDNEISHFFTHDRYLNGQKHDYTGYYRNYEEINGIRIPTEIEAVWNLPEGDFSYARFVLTNIIYNKFDSLQTANMHPVAAP